MFYIFNSLVTRSLKSSVSFIVSIWTSHISKATVLDSLKM